MFHIISRILAHYGKHYYRLMKKIHTSMLILSFITLVILHIILTYRTYYHVILNLWCDIAIMILTCVKHLYVIQVGRFH